VKGAGPPRRVLYGEGMERVELHFHLLPGVDDGPSDLANALELARAAVRDGTRLVTCTPHAAFVDVAEIPERVRDLQAALGEAGIDLEVGAGAELSWDDVADLSGAELETVAQGPPGRRWLLLEAPLPGTGTLDGLQASAQELRDRGFGLLIGHPERSPALSGAPGAVERLLAAGDRLQVNGSSLTGYHGARARAAALELVGAGRATVIASDAHRPDDRAPSLSAAVAVLRRHGTSLAQAEALVGTAPRALLERGLAPRERLAA
jgi:protein-tyrosine phosphatase